MLTPPRSPRIIAPGQVHRDGRRGRAMKLTPMRFTTIEGTDVTVQVTSPADAKRAIKELRHRKKEVGLHRRALVRQQKAAQKEQVRSERASAERARRRGVIASMTRVASLFRKEKPLYDLAVDRAGAADDRRGHAQHRRVHPADRRQAAAQQLAPPPTTASWPPKAARRQGRPAPRRGHQLEARQPHAKLLISPVSQPAKRNREPEGSRDAATQQSVGRR